MSETQTAPPELSDWLTLEQAARKLSVAGKTIRRERLWAWCQKGVRGVTLRHSWLGRQILVTEADVRAFLAELQQVTQPVTQEAGIPARRVSPARRAADLERVQSHLERRLNQKGGTASPS
jgi:hypothetical protein